MSKALLVFLAAEAFVATAFIANPVGSLKLPFIGLEVTRDAVWLAPVVLLLVHLHFLINVDHHLRLLARMPLVFPDGTSVEEKVHPWGLNSLARLRYGDSLRVWRAWWFLFLSYYSLPVLLLLLLPTFPDPMRWPEPVQDLSISYHFPVSWILVGLSFLIATVALFRNWRLFTVKN